MNNMAMIKLISAGVVITGLLSYTLFQSPATERINATPVNEQKSDKVMLPDFLLKTSDGKQVNLNSFKGKMVFVNLWATWCGPCRREMPSIDSLYLKTSNKKGVFVILSLDDDFNKAINYGVAQKFHFPLYYPATNLPALFNVDGIPATFIFNEAGELVQTIQGSTNYNTEAFVKLMNNTK